MKPLGEKVSKWVAAGGQLLVLKVLLFLFFGATHSLIPYLVVHMRQLGIDVNQTAIIHAVLPVAMFVGPPVSGFLADKSGGFRILLFVSLILTGVSHTCLLWVPSSAPADQLSRVALVCHPTNHSLHVLFDLPSPTSCSLNIRHQLHLAECRLTCPSLYTAIDNGSRSSKEVFCPSWPTSGSSVCLWRVAENEFRARGGANDTVRAFSSSPDLANGSSACDQLMPDGCALSCERPEGWEAFRDTECGDRALTFWVYMVIRVVASVFMSSSYVLLDAITLILIKDKDTDYGKQRVWPIVATAIFPPITGALVDSISGDNPNYTPTFYVHDALLLLTAILSPLLSLQMKFSQETNVKAVASLVKTPRADTLFVFLFLLGTMWGFVEVFLYLYLLDLGSPKYLLGLTLTVGSGVGIPVLFFSGKIIQRFGHVPIIFVAFLFYSVRYIGYSFMYDPWWCLAFEAMEIFTLHLLWVAVVKYSSTLAPKGLQATMQGAIGGTHYGVGRGSGSLIGGLLMGRFGARATFFYMGIASGIAGILYIAVEKIFFRKPFVYASQNTSKDDEKMDEKKSEGCEISTISGNKEHNMEEIRL